MAQAVSLAVLFAVVLLLRGPGLAATMSSGNWAESFGRLIVGPFVFFFIAQAILYYGTKLVRGYMGHSFTTSRLNYLSLVVSLLGILGSLASQAR